MNGEGPPPLQAGLAGSAAACRPTAWEPRLPIQSRGSARDKYIKVGGLQTWGDYRQP